MNIEKAFPYISQSNNYTCGPTCIEMLLQYYDIDYKKKEVFDFCDAKPILGLDNSTLVDCLKFFTKTNIYENENTNINDFILFVKNKKLPIANFINPTSGVGHFAIFKDFKDSKFILADPNPNNGNDFELDLDYFKNHWHSNDKSIKKWMMFAIC